MSNIGATKGVLEVAKLAVYIAVPIGLMYNFASNTTNLKKVIDHHQYVVYPPEGERPASPEELSEMAREITRKRKTHGGDGS